MTNKDWLDWWNEQVEQERAIEKKRELLVIRGFVLISCIIVASVYVFVKYWSVQ